MQEVYKFLKDANIFYVGTVEGNQPRVRPFGALNVFEDKLYILTNNKKEVYKQIKNNNKVEICTYNGKEWIRIECQLVEDESKVAKKDFLDHNEYLRKMYSEDDDLTVVFYINNAKATFTSFETHESKEIRF